MSYDDLPVYGPTQILPDEGIEPDVVVRVAYALSREQLAIALGIGWAQIAADGRSPEDLTVAEIREEVEGILGASAVLEIDTVMERDRRRTWSPRQQAVMEQIAAAIDRAYPPRRPEPVRKPPRYGNGTVTIATFDQGDVTVPEPAWCIGHGSQPNPHRSDITHNSVRVKAGADTDEHGPVDILEAYVTHAPYLVQQPEPHPVIAVQLDVTQSFAAEDITNLNRGLHLAVIRLARLAAEALHLRDGGQA